MHPEPAPSTALVPLDGLVLSEARMVAHAFVLFDRLTWFDLTQLAPTWLHDWYAEHAATKRLLGDPSTLPACWRARMPPEQLEPTPLLARRAQQLNRSFVAIDETASARHARALLHAVRRDRAASHTRWLQHRLDYLEALHNVRRGHWLRWSALRAIVLRLAHLALLLDAGSALARVRRRSDDEQLGPDASIEHALPRETRAGPIVADDDADPACARDARPPEGPAR